MLWVLRERVWKAFVVVEVVLRAQYSVMLVAGNM